MYLLIERSEDRYTGPDNVNTRIVTRPKPEESALDDISNAERVLHASAGHYTLLCLTTIGKDGQPASYELPEMVSWSRLKNELLKEIPKVLERFNQGQIKDG